MSETTKARRSPDAKVFGRAGLGKRMRAAREQAKLSVDDVAKALRLSPSAVRNWEGAHKVPSRENLDEFASIAAVDVAWLTTGFSEENLRLAEKLAEGPDPIPFLEFDQLNVLAHAEPGYTQAWPDARSIFPSYRCSDQAFAFAIFDNRNGPDYERYDIAVIDPTFPPSHDEWVLAALGPARVPFFARYVLRELDPHVDQRVKQLSVDLIEKGVAELIDGAGAEKTRQFLQELIDKLRRGEYGETRDPPDAWLAPSRGPIVPFRGSEDRMLGLLVEHRRPRRGAELFPQPKYLLRKK